MGHISLQRDDTPKLNTGCPVICVGTVGAETDSGLLRGQSAAGEVLSLEN